MPYKRPYRKKSKKPVVASRRRKAPGLNKTEKRDVKKIVLAGFNKRAENLMNYGRYVYQEPGTAQASFEGARYWLGNISGTQTIQGETFFPMNTISALAVNQNVAAGLPQYNQTYHGKEIFGKYFNSTITLTMPSLRTIAVGGADWQQIPTNFSYRIIIYKQQKRPSSNITNTAGSSQPFSTTGFKNEVGTMFGISSPATEAVPDPTGTAQPWINNDLMTSRVNKTNYKVLYEKRGKLSLSSTMSATANPASVTAGPARYPSEAVFRFSHKIMKKLQLQNRDQTPQVPVTTTTTQITNYDNTIGMFLVMNPLGEGLPTQQGTAETFNAGITPYIHISNSFTFNDF